MGQANLYKVTDDTVLTPEYLNSLLGDIDTRIRGVEAIRAKLASAISDLQAVGLARINDTVAPLIAQVQADVAEVQENLAGVTEQIEQLLQGAVPAASIVENATRVFVTPEQRARIGETAAAIATLQQTVSTTITDAIAALAPKADADLSGTVALVTEITPPILDGDQANWNPDNLRHATTVRIASSKRVTISGLAAGRSGELKILDNVGTFDVTLATEAPASASGNRFALGEDHVLRPGQSLMLRYVAASARWRAIANNARSSAPPGMRAQFDIAPPAPWLPLQGGAILNASYPKLAQVHSVDAGLAAATSSLNWSALPGLDTLLPGAVCIGLAKGLGFYWAVFWRSETGGTHALQVYRTANMLLGPWSKVLEEHDVTAGQALGYSADHAVALGARQIEFSPTQGAFAFGNTLVVLSATTCTAKRAFFPSSFWDQTTSKAVCYVPPSAKWLFADFKVNGALGQVLNLASDQADTSGTAQTRMAAGASIKKLAWWDGRVWAMNALNKDVIPVFCSFDEGLNWSGAGTGVLGAVTSGPNTSVDLAVVNDRLCVMFSGSFAYGASLFISSPDRSSFEPNTSDAVFGVLSMPGAHGDYMLVLNVNSGLSYRPRSGGAWKPLTADQFFSYPSPMHPAGFVFDELNNTVWSISASGQASRVVLSPDPKTMAVLPTVTTTPPTYVYGG
ncbi:hypothetical protein [Caulobacter segnis]|uniref:Uncharacterized protein n=1 Tax=Caulobacter segnis TaxID=88688 RepID=A0A2W5XH16_9CAUL|nr:hypothetical protein [Caulobacter segnis]PZR37181.1 MAG: hypothetical protein DI526_01305 [Caulobacter segnis]